MEQPGDKEDLVVDHQVTVGSHPLGDQEAPHAVPLHRPAGLARHLAERGQRRLLRLAADQILSRHLRARHRAILPGGSGLRCRVAIMGERPSPLSSSDMSSLLAERGPIHVHVGATVILEGRPRRSRSCSSTSTRG